MSAAHHIDERAAPISTNRLEIFLPHVARLHGGCLPGRLRPAMAISRSKRPGHRCTRLPDRRQTEQSRSHAVPRCCIFTTHNASSGEATRASRGIGSAVGRVSTHR
jgi:hypothetical protein